MFISDLAKEFNMALKSEGISMADLARATGKQRQTIWNMTRKPLQTKMYIDLLDRMGYDVEIVLVQKITS